MITRVSLAQFSKRKWPPSVPWTLKLKTDFSSPMQSFLYLFDVHGSKCPEVTSCWISNHFGHTESPKVSARSYSSICAVHIGMHSLQCVEIMRIKKIFAYWGRKSHHGELARFADRWLFRKSTIAGVCFRTHRLGSVHWRGMELSYEGAW